MRSESEDQSQRLDGDPGQDKRAPQWRGRKKYNRRQYKKPPRQQHQETHDLHSEIPRRNANGGVLPIATQAKISQSHWNPTHLSNKNEDRIRFASREALESGGLTTGRIV